MAAHTVIALSQRTCYQQPRQSAEQTSSVQSLHSAVPPGYKHQQHSYACDGHSAGSEPVAVVEYQSRGSGGYPQPQQPGTGNHTAACAVAYIFAGKCAAYGLFGISNVEYVAVEPYKRIVAQLHGCIVGAGNLVDKDIIIAVLDIQRARETLVVEKEFAAICQIMLHTPVRVVS